MNLAEKIDEYIKNEYEIKQKEFEDYVFEKLTGENFNKGFMVFSKDTMTKEEAVEKKLDERYLYKNRYYYVEKLENNNDKKVIFVLFNSSGSNPEKLDSTVQNCREIALQEEFSQIEVLNLFSIRNPKVDKNELNEDIDSDNIDLINDLLCQRTDCDVVLAWGYGKEQEKKFQNRINSVKEIIKKYKLNPKKITVEEKKDKVSARIEDYCIG